MPYIALVVSSLFLLIPPFLNSSLINLTFINRFLNSCVFPNGGIRNIFLPAFYFYFGIKINNFVFFFFFFNFNLSLHS
jgi:hypothetical protein